MWMKYVSTQFNAKCIDDAQNLNSPVLFGVLHHKVEGFNENLVV